VGSVEIIIAHSSSLLVVRRSKKMLVGSKARPRTLPCSGVLGT
jgi:hypothetical protein